MAEPIHGYLIYRILKSQQYSVVFNRIVKSSTVHLSDGAERQVRDGCSVLEGECRKLIDNENANYWRLAPGGQ